jgi:hypothetical protein
MVRSKTTLKDETNATEHYRPGQKLNLAFISIGADAAIRLTEETKKDGHHVPSLQEEISRIVRDLSAESPCMVSVNVVTHRKDINWKLDRLVPPGFDSRVHQHLAMIWPKGRMHIRCDESWKLEQPASWPRESAEQFAWRTQGSTLMTCCVRDPSGICVSNMTIPKGNACPLLLEVLNHRGQEPFIMGGGLQSTISLMTTYVKAARDGNSKWWKIFSGTKQNPAVKCIAFAPGFLVEQGEDVQTTSADINVLRIHATKLPAASSYTAAKRWCELTAASSNRPASSYRASADENMVLRAGTVVLRAASSDPWKRSRDDIDKKDVFAAMIMQLFHCVSPKIKFDELQKMTQEAVRRRLWSVSDPTDTITEIASYVMFNKDGKIKNMQETLEEWSGLTKYRDRVIDRNHRERDLTETEKHNARDDWCRFFLQNRLTPQQKRNPKYYPLPRNNRHVLTTKQRGLTGAILRRLCGHKAVVMSLLQWGLPCSSISQEGLQEYANNTDPDRIQNDMNTMIKYFIAIGTGFADRRATPEYALALSASGNKKPKKAQSANAFPKRKGQWESWPDRTSQSSYAFPKRKGQWDSWQGRTSQSRWQDQPANKKHKTDCDAHGHRPKRSLHAQDESRPSWLDQPAKKKHKSRYAQDKGKQRWHRFERIDNKSQGSWCWVPNTAEEPHSSREEQPRQKKRKTDGYSGRSWR